VGLLRALVGVWTKDALRHSAWLAGAAAGAVALFVADGFSASTLAGMDQLFSTSAQVLAGLSVALPLGGAITERTRPLAGPLAPAVALVLVALVASLIALVPGVCPTGLRLSFSLVAAGVMAGVAALALVLTEAVGLRITDEEWARRLAGFGADEPTRDQADREREHLIQAAITGGLVERYRARRDLRRLARRP
jgi:hypothetical protein